MVDSNDLEGFGFHGFKLSNMRQGSQYHGEEEAANMATYDAV